MTSENHQDVNVIIIGFRARPIGRALTGRALIGRALTGRAGRMAA
jgi:hypothetical protein